MALLKSTQLARGNVPVPNADRAIEIIPVFGDYVLAGTEANGDIIEILPLPPGMVPVDMIVDTEDCGTTMTVDAGVMSGDYGASGARTCGAEFMNDKAFGTAGVYRADAVGMSRVAPANNARGIGLKIDAAVSALSAGAKIRATLLCRPAIESV